MMGFPTFFSRVPSRFLPTSSMARSSFSAMDMKALNSLTFSSRALLRAARTPALEGAISTRVLGGRGVANRSAQVKPLLRGLSLQHPL